MTIKFKINLAIAMLISAFSLFIISVSIFIAFGLIPKSIASYLTGFSLMASIPLFVITAINYFVFGSIAIMKRKANIDKFNMKLFYILNSLGVIPIVYYFLAIAFMGY